ncbi:MAG: ECF transporter S component [Clostridiaceae bacterium]|nr:ECF transporter S component [Clostridiaceae bacterium]
MSEHKRLRDNILLALFAAIVVLLSFTPIGFIDLPFIKATIIHVPVILASILLGWRRGAVVGFIFGLTSLIRNTIGPSALSFAFSPFIPVYGSETGSLWSLLIAFLPRIMIGITPALVYGIYTYWLKRRGASAGKGLKVALQLITLTAAGLIGSMTNTILVMGLIYLIFGSQLAALNNVPPDLAIKVVLGVVTGNGLMEAVVAMVITAGVATPLLIYLQQRRK